MRRRTLLAVAGLSIAAPLGGCLGDSGPDDLGGTPTDPGETAADPGSDHPIDPNSGTTDTMPTDDYETCDLVSIEYESLPGPVRAEVDAALDDGDYRSDDLRFDEAVDPDRSYVVVDDTPYKPTVEVDGDAKTLTLEEADVVRLPEPRVVEVRNVDDRPHEVHVELSNGEVLIDETVSLEPDGSRDVEASDAFGRYELRAKALTGHEDEAEFQFRVGDSAFDGVVEVGADELFVTQAVAELEPCPWDERYG